MTSHCLLASIVFDKKLPVNLIVALCDESLLLLSRSLSLSFDSLIILPDVNLFELILLGFA